MYGLNIDPNNPRGNPDPEELRELGVDIVRYTFYDGSGGEGIDPGKAQLYTDRAKRYAEKGIRSLVILTYDTYPGKPHFDADWNGYIEKFARRSGQIAKLLAPWKPAYQVWNEPDHDRKNVGTPYDPCLREEVFAAMLRRTYDTIKAADPSARVVLGGLASGDHRWLPKIIQLSGGKLPADVVAFHPYGQRPEPEWPAPNWAFGYIGTLLNNYYKAGGNRPVWITEMGIKEEDLGNNRDQAAEFLRRYYRTINSRFGEKVEELFWFCYSDGMVPSFGLCEANGNRKPIYQAFRQVVAERPVRQVEPAVPAASPPVPVAEPPTPVVPPVAPAPSPVVPAPPPVVVPGPPLPVEVAPVMPGGNGAPVKVEGAELPQEVRQLQEMMAGLQAQMQALQQQVAQLQAIVQQLSQQQARLQEQVQQVQPPVHPGPVVPPVSPGPSPVIPARPAPPIQDIANQLKRHPSLPYYPSRPLSQISRLIIHHTAISPAFGADRIAAYRVDNQGWPGIGYHYFITADGVIQQTNELTTVSNHAGDYNPVAIGVCFAGDFTNTVPTPIQIEAGAQLVAWLMRQFNISAEMVSGYKELVNTQSPGQQWDTGQKWGEQFRQQVQAYL